jgi:hypothetical protein
VARVKRVKAKSRNEVRGKRVKDEDFEQARRKELQSFVDTNTYLEVPYTGQHVISSRWVHTLKLLDDGGVKAKARLVARGFEDAEQGLLTSSPTCGRGMYRLAVQLCANRGWVPSCIDITTAFLQGEPLNRDVYLQPPRGYAEDNVVWKLLKGVYGLSDAPRKWYLKVARTFRELKSQMVPFDQAFFYWLDDNGVLIGIITVHVDDFYWGGTEEFDKKIMAKIRKIFPVGKERRGDFIYCGLLHRTEELGGGKLRITLDQHTYVESIEKVDVGVPPRSKSEHLSEEMQTEYRALVGALLWATGQTRPDIAFDVASAAAHNSKATYEQLKKLNAIVDKAKRSDVAMVYTSIPDKDIVLLGYADAAWANLPNGGTGGGYVVGLSDLHTFGFLSWRCRRLKRIVKSTLAGETLALTDLVDELVVLRETMKRMTGVAPRTIARTDCMSLHDHIMKGKQVQEKRLHVELSMLKEVVENKECEIEWVETAEQLSDCLTKHMVAHRLLAVMRTGTLNPY